MACVAFLFLRSLPADRRGTFILGAVLLRTLHHGGVALLVFLERHELTFVFLPLRPIASQNKELTHPIFFCFPGSMLKADSLDDSVAAALFWFQVSAPLFSFFRMSFLATFFFIAAFRLFPV